MRRFVIRALLKPGLAIAFCVAFGGFFVFGGFQSVRIELRRSAAGTVNGTLTRSHFFGLYTVSANLRAIRQAAIETGQSRPRFGIVVPVSGVALVSGSGRTPVFAGMSNVDETYKRRIARTLNEYLRNGDGRPLRETFAVKNVFGWVGLPFLLLGLSGAVMWPLTIVRCWRADVAAAH